MPSSEILAVLADEVSEAEEALRTALANLISADDDTTFGQGIELYSEQVERIDNVAKILSMAGLQEICAFLISNLEQLKRDTLNQAQQTVLEQWPKLVLGYLRAPKEGVYCRELAEHFHKPNWPAPLDHGDAIGLEQALLAINDAPDDAEPKAQRQTNAVPEDISLEPASNINPILMDAFLSEGPLQAAQFSSVVERIIRGEGFASEVDEARRIVHALKGAANTVNVRGIATMAHHVEDILEYLADNAITPSGELAKLLVQVADCMEIMFEYLLGKGEPPSDALRILQDVLILANRIDSGAFEPEADLDEVGLSAVAPTTVAPTIEPVIETATPEAKIQTPAPVAQVKDDNTKSPKIKIEPKLRIPARAIDDMLSLSGEIAISRGHVQERLQQTLKLLAELHERDNALWARANNLESLVSTQGIAAGKRQALATTLEDSTNTETFDPLEMDQYSELHTQVHGFVETIADLQLLGTQVLDALTTVDSSVNQQALLNNELHDLLMTSRMIPVSMLGPRLQRTVRQAAEKSGKLAMLTVEGGDVMLDDQMVNELIDPLLHILRNAVDHGLEAPEARGQFNKADTGSIVLGFARDGNYLNIKCQDDGAGLDLFRIHATAVDRGLITEQQNLTDEEIARLILQPGFSTATEVTELSGRGVGMDIVNTNITKLKGTIDIKTEIGVGCAFTLRVPISMGMAHCLLTDVDKQVFALPSDKLDRIIYGGAKNINHIGKRLVYRDETDTCPVYIMSKLLHYSDREEIDAEDNRTVILMRDIERGKIAIVVDNVSSGRDLVIKAMGKYVTNISGVVGTSILGDGTVVPILEVSDMLRRKQGLANSKTTSTVASAQPTIKEFGDILIVDDSLSVRTALTLLLNADNIEVRTAKDGVEAMEEIEKALPAAILLDMEMPRMNGLELTTLLRSKAQTKHLPIIMVTSRTADKHRTQAQLAGVNHYITKPYQENELLALLRLTMSKAA
jgi:chemosensory pili system protein ChpA (sensor histidine kinase/response regulator)